MLIGQGRPLRKRGRALLGTYGAVTPTLSLSSSFAEDQNSTPWYGNTVSPSGLLANNKVWQAWEAWNGDEREVRVRVWSNYSTTPTPGREFVIGKSTLQNDSHGVPSIAYNAADGRVWAVFGRHSNLGIQRLYVTTNADDPADWTKLTDITGEGNIGYPHPYIVAGKMFLFMREDDDATTNRRYGKLKIGTITGASISWAAGARFADLGDDTRWYLGYGHVDAAGQKIHLVAARANLADTYRRDVYYMIYDCVADTFSNFDGSLVVASATWRAAAINRATLDASFRIVDLTTGLRFGAAPNLVVVGGKAHITYKNSASSPPQDCFYIQATLGVNSWSAPAALGQAYNGSGDYALGLQPNGTDLAHWFRDQQNNMCRCNISAAGVVGAKEIVFKPRPGAQLDNPAWVYGSPWFAFAESNDDETVEGSYPVFMHSGSAIVNPRGVRGAIDQLFGGLTLPDAGRIAAYSAFIDAGLTDGWWKNLKGFWFLDVDGGAHLRNWKNGQFDLTQVGTGNGFTGGVLGWTGNGTDRYLRSSLIFNAEMTRTATALGLAATGGTHVSGETARIGCTNSTTAMLVVASSVGPVIQLSCTNSYGGVDTALDGIFQGKRVGTALTVYGADGLPSGAGGTATDTAPGAVNFVIGQAKGTGFGTATIFAAYIGHDLSDAMALSFRNALRTLINTLAPGSIA